MVKIISETDDDGNQVTKKFVNGEEVELSEEDMEKIKMHEFKHDDGHHMSKTIKIDGESEIDIKEILKEIEIELENINIHEINDEEGHHVIKMIKIDGEEGEVNMEELLKEIEIDVDKDGHNVFIKTIDINGLENDINWNSEDVHFDSGDQEDFTIVLVTEDIDENTSQSKSNVIRSKRKSLEGLKVYPNPTSEMITIEFAQEEKIKTSISIIDMNGKNHFLGKCIGYGLPYSVQYTNPQKLTRYQKRTGEYDEYGPMPQPDPNGLFMPTGLSATWLMLINPDTGAPQPVYVEPSIMVSPFKLH